MKIGEDGSLTFNVPGVGSLSGGPGSVDGGSLEVSTLAGDANPAGPVPTVAGGPGMDVKELDGATIAKPLTLSLDASAPRPGLVPVIAHRRDDGRWEYLAPTWDGSTATLHTKNFSPNLLGWIDPSQWVAKLKSAAATLVTGRQPRPSCAGGAHSWATMNSDTNLVHSCLISNDADGVQRVEMQLKSNRGSFLQVDIPDGVDYAWVEGQNATTRRRIGTVVRVNGDRTVMLPPGGRMTVGWRQPAGTSEPAVTVSVTQRTILLTGVFGFWSAFDVHVDSDFLPFWGMVTECAEEFGQGLGKNAAVGAWDVFRCMATKAAVNLANPRTAYATAHDLLGNGIDAAALSTQISKLTRVGTAMLAIGAVVRVLAAVAAARDAVLGVYSSLSDAIVAAVAGTGDHVAVLLRGSQPRTSTPQPPVQAPGPNPAPAPKPAPAPAPNPAPNPAPAPPPAPSTWSETVGSEAHTWTNYTNAGGSEGPTIPRYSTVQIACTLEGFRVANGNTWWYRIASSPWNNAFYVSADAFYNNGATSGSLKGTPWVDPAVRHC